VDANGLILTNYHVVQPSADWDLLGISITTESDQPPAPSYLAELVAGDEEVDLAVIRIVADAKGNAVTASKLGLTPVPLGDAGELEIGDDLTIFGYPGIGSGTITLTEGKVSGFLQEQGIDYQRAWIKTDAAISGGNSGGTAVDEFGKLVAVPTRLGDIDVRRIADTNGDGIIDERDNALSTGGFINQLRPINLALPIIEQARKGSVTPGTGKPPVVGSPTPAPTPSGRRPTTQPSMTAFVFASQVDKNDQPLDPGTIFGGGITELFAFTDYAGMANKANCEYEWTIDDDVVADGAFAWTAGTAGTYSFSLNNSGDELPEGDYGLSVWVNGKLLRSGGATVYSGKESSSVTLNGYLYDADTGRPVPNGFFYVLAPGVTVSDFVRMQQEWQVIATGKSGRDGFYRVSPGLERGNTYSVIVFCRGYLMVAEDDALSIDANTPEQVEMQPIYLSRY
jgi:hypothetical protein